MIPDFESKTVKSHDIMIDDWLLIGESLCRVLDTGHASMETVAVDHVLLMLKPAWDEPVEIIQLMLPVNFDVVIHNQI